MTFQLIETPIQDLYLIEPKCFGDNRGFFLEIFNEKKMKEIGIKQQFVQDNLSVSKRGVLRGLHFQSVHAQAKLVSVIKGRAYDVAVDLRKGSPTFLQYFGTELSDQNKLFMFIPEGFAHGFLALENDTIFHYKVSDFYCGKCDGGLVWNDSQLNIKWPFKESNIEKPLLSVKDEKLPTLDNFDNKFVYIQN